MVWLGETVAELEDAFGWEPTWWSMLTVSAPESDQDRVEFWPAVMAPGEALNAEITGAVPEQATVADGVTVTVVGPTTENVT